MRLAAQLISHSRTLGVYDLTEIDNWILHCRCPATDQDAYWATPLPKEPVLLRDWLAANTDAWIWYLHDFRRVLDVLPPWRAAGDGETFKPRGYCAFFLTSTRTPMRPCGSDTSSTLLTLFTHSPTNVL
jgi:hypothetical protein